MAFYLKIKYYLIFLFLVTQTRLSLSAQDTGSYWQADYAFGSIIEHKKLIGHLVKAHPEFLSISWQQNSPTDVTWKKRYNYPDWGFSISYQNFNNPTLGKVIGLQYQTTYYLLNRNAKNQLNLQMRTGIAYNTNPLSLSDNNKNVAMSSSLQLAEFIKLDYKIPNLFKNIGFHTGLLLTHYSNASYKNPNFGINSLFLSTGFDWQKSEKLYYPKKPIKKRIPKQKIHLNTALYLGVHEAKAGLGDKPVYIISGYGSKKIGNKSTLQFGFDFFNSQAVKDFAGFRYHIQIESPDRVLLDHKQIGLFGGHELVFNKISLETLVGYYLYNPLKYSPSIYQKIALKHNLNSKKTALSLNLKVHNFKAEYLTLGFHYQLL
jgi:hypothetical protein